MDTLTTTTEGEDSSYDSECDTDVSHEQVSRTTSDTLGQEFAEYVGQPQLVKRKIDRSTGYIQRVEFALKLGYTERLVELSLERLGSDPTQNELLGELIKLGALQGNKSDLCDLTCQQTNAFDSTSPHSNGESDDTDPRSNGLRPIVIDGSNVAYCHGNKEAFSCLGIRLCVDWFRNRGHKEITVFVPKFRKENPRPDNPIKDQEILFELEKERMLVYTPSRFVGGKRTVCYDDRYILKLASENDGIVVSNDNYRDLANESIEFKKVVEERVLMYSFVSDLFMPPDDPLGRSGPTLDNFLRTQAKKSDPLPPCPYGKKCTYGQKCKFNHPERAGPHKSITERLSEHAARHLSARYSDGNNKHAVCGKSLSVPLNSNSEMNADRRTLARARSCAHDSCKVVTSCNDTTPNQSISMTKSGSKNVLTNVDQNLKKDVRNIHSESYSGDNKSKDMRTHSMTQNTHRNVCRTDTFKPITAAPPLLYVESSCNNQKMQAPIPSQNPLTPLENNDNVNLHKKLRRQLSLNPCLIDQNMYGMQNAIQMHTRIENSQPQQPQLLHGHRPLVPSHSGPRTHMPNHWDLHQNVTRIASAPDASISHNKGSNSMMANPIAWPQHNSYAAIPPPSANITSTQANRLHIQYHLSSIFPEQQVLLAMQMHPEETNPQNICAAILSMFPKV